MLIMELLFDHGEVFFEMHLVVAVEQLGWCAYQKQVGG